MRSDKIKGALAALVALALLLSFAACMPAAVPISEPVAEAPTEAPSAETPAPTEEPEFRPLWAKTGAAQNAHSEKLPVIPDDDFSDFPVYTFYSEEQIEEALAAEHTDTHDPLYGLECLYVPENLPEGAEFEFFWVSDSYVSSFYKLASGDELRLTMQRYISTLSEYLAGAEPDCEEIQTKDCGDYLLVRCEPSRSVVWEQDGQLLELTLPETFSEDDILGFRRACSAARVDLTPLYPEILTFDTERDFFDAANNADENSVLYGLTGYFALYAPPAGNEKIYHMEVDAEEQLLVYGDMPDAPVFSYLRGTQPGELTSLYGPGDTAADIGNVLMVDTEYTIGGCRALYWSQGSDCFCIRYIWRASAPEFTEEQVASLCRAGFVTDPAQAGAAETPLPPDEPEEEFIYLFVKDGGVEYPVYEHFRYGQTYVSESDGMLNADGAPFYSQLAELYDELPVFVSGPELDVSIAEGCRIVEIHAYDTALRPVDTPDTTGDIGEFLRNVSEELIIDIVVRHDRNYIESLGKYEFMANGYAFRVVPEGTAVGAKELRFSSLEEFDAAVREGRGDPDSMFYGLEGYYTPFMSFVPDRDPVTISASADMVKYEYVCTSTMSNGETDTRDYTFVWHRNADPAEAEELAESIGAGYETFEAVRLINDVWVVWTWGPEMANVWVNESGEVFEFRFPFIMDSNIATWPYATWVSLDEPAATPSCEETPEPETQEEVRYTDLDAFNAALREGRGDPDSSFYGLEGYYLLKNEQRSAKGRFKWIILSEDRVEVEYDCYDIEWPVDESDPNRFVLIWHRNLGADEAEELINSIIDKTCEYQGLIEEDGVWMIQSDEVEKHGVLISDRGDVLEIIAPLWFDDPFYMLPLARADWVPIS